MADRPANALRVFNVTHPSGEQFRAAAVGDDKGYRAESNRTGKWAPESMFNFSDLMHPEQNLAEWDIVPDDEGAEEEVQPEGRPSFLYVLNEARAALATEGATPTKKPGKPPTKDGVAGGGTVDAPFGWTGSREDLLKYLAAAGWRPATD